MNRNPTGLVLVLVFLIVFHGCDASLLSKIRKLASGIDPKNNNVPQEISPSVSPSPVPGVDLLTNGGIVSNSENHKKNVQTPYTSPAPSPAGAESQITERCMGSSESCHYQKDINMTACLYSPSNDKCWDLLYFCGFLSVSGSRGHAALCFRVEIVDGYVVVHVSDGGSPSIVLNAGNGKCIIHLGSSKPKNMFMNLPPYASHVSPTHGAYVLFLAALVIGGTWACCKLRKKGPQVDGIAYQELEMAQPDSPTANHAETTDGWDQGWDDDWDDVETVKSPSARQNGNASLNGRTSRSSDKDGW
ncbi:hypothetical protein FEM48_Zijuj03G0118000 [Ziziphus jujuba var. spinosa]|uniref:Uncharacterized protein n=1 Tax=Ziziphus jujuba var. spinosa TaxID=714518 RepID=A0A978VQ50_ZIZJJ|nr:hypothetical protein FEM48_Zijuj03G0118000 [Ziziphus jujuba var. spinosa]